MPDPPEPGVCRSALSPGSCAVNEPLPPAEGEEEDDNDEDAEEDEHDEDGGD